MWDKRFDFTAQNTKDLQRQTHEEKVISNDGELRTFEKKLDDNSRIL